MTAQQLDAHAAQILHLSVCDPTSTAVIDLQQQHTAATAGANGGGGSGYSNAGGASHESQAATPENSGGNKRKRRPAGTPDPDAEVVALSPKTLMESDRYICEICNQGFQRDQNLQMHRRRHKVPWKLLKKARLATHKRVYVCPELTCLHHDPAHALGDLVGIKKHFRRKHCTEKQWVCDKCSKGYAVQSDYKAHLKTCGTRGHCCDCGKVFSRVESFIEHQDTCAAAIQKGSMQSGNDSKSTLQRSTTTTSRRNVSSTESPSQSSADTSAPALFTLSGISDNTAPSTDHSSRLNEQVSTRLDSSTSHAATNARTEMNTAWSDLAAARRTKEQARLESTEAQNEIARAELLKREAREQLQQASAEKALADHARDMAKRQMDIAEAELADAKRIREHAQAEIEKSRLLKDQQSRESLHSPLHDAAMRVSSRDHNLQMSSNYICEVCESVPVGRDLALGLHQSTNRTPMMMPSRVGSWPESTENHKIRLSQINAPNEVNTRTGLVNYLTTRENTSEPSPSYSSYNEPNPTRLFSHMIGEPSTCRSWSVGSGASDAGEGRSSCEFLEASVPTIATFATSMTVQAPSTSKNPRTSTHHSQSQGS
ncbi:unnamed protein product [Sphagnum troendelagicum]|uniref:C2H2-type domain-containing protein n=1 Tax=Sphagnum troendelagicum TaxID=128251 RepID=A0ABP0UA01_9BRYO